MSYCIGYLIALLHSMTTPKFLVWEVETKRLSYFGNPATQVPYIVRTTLQNMPVSFK